jgi:hypothetical protein
MGFALSHSRKQRIHIDSSMFSSALTDWTVVITDSMVPELAEAGGLLDSAGPALSDGHDIRIAADANGDVALPIDLRGFSQAADPANGGIEFATKIPLTDPVAGNDIYLFYGDDDALAVLPTDPLGQYAAYDDDTIFYAPVGGGANRTAFNITGTDVGGITAGDIAAPSGLLGTQHTDVGDYSTYGDNPDLDLVNTDWTVSFLFRATTSGLEQYILGKYNHTTQDRGYLCIFSGSQHFDLTYQPVRTSYNPIYRLSSGVDVVDGQWHHLGGTFISGTRASVYTEGILRNTTTNNIPSSVASNNASFQIGTQVTAQNQPADFSHVTVHSVARSADWIASNHANFMQGDTLLTGYNYSPVLGEVIPYSGNEAAYEAFNSIGGGYFQGDGNAQFDINEISFPYTTPFKLTFRHKNTYNGYDAIIGYKATNEHRIFTNNGELNFAGVSIDIEADADSLWHTYELIFDGADFRATKDGSPIGSMVATSITTGNWVWEQLLAYRTTKSQNAFQFIEIEIDGVITHRWDFCHANAAGNDGPNYVLNRLNDNHGRTLDAASNWKRDAVLTDALLDGFNLYENAVVPAVPNYGRVDALGVALEYYAHIATGDAVYTPINEGGFFKGNNNAYFDLGQSLAVPATVDVSIRFKYRKSASAFFAILGNGIYNSEAVEVDFAGNLQFRAPTGGGSTQVVAMNAKADSLWHEYQIDYNQATNTISTYKDGSPITLDHVANFNGGVWDWSFLLRRTPTSQVFVDEIAFIEISIDGVVGHYFDFGLANAAGDAGPDIVWDLVGGIHGAGVNTEDSNWGRTVSLPNNLPNGYNLYYREPGVVWPATVVDDTIDPFGVAIQYDNAITGQSINGELFENASIFYDGSVNPGNVSISGQLHTNPQTFYNGLLTPGNVIISGQLFTNTSIFYNNIIDSGSTVIYGNVYANTPTFYSGSIETGNVNISGGLHTNVSTFFDNEVRPSNYNISGNVYVNPQTFYSGSITGGEAVINGGLYTNPQTFYEGVISTSGVVVSGELFANSPVFFNNEFTLGTVVVNGELFTNVNVFYNNAIIQGLSILGELFINTNVFYPSLVFPESDHIDGELFENASVFYANEIALAPEDFIEIHIALSAKPFASIDFTARQGVQFEDVSSPQTVNGVLFINSQTFYIGEIEWL